MDLDEELRRQAGVISRRQALAAGLSRSAIAARVVDGRWRLVYPRVYLARHHTLTDEARLRAAALWAGPDATVSGVAAAWWYGLWPSCPSTVDITVPRRQAPQPRPGVRVRRRDLDGRDRANHRGLPATALPLTVLEAAVALGDDGSRLLDRALQGRVQFRDVVEAHHRNLGRRGSGAAAKLLAAAGDRADSQAERVLKGLLREAELRRWRMGYVVDGCQLDFAYLEDGRHRGRRLGLALGPDTVPKGPAAAEHSGTARLDRTSVHLARPDSAP